MNVLLHLFQLGRNLSRRTPRPSGHHAINAAERNEQLCVMPLNSKR